VTDLGKTRLLFIGTGILSGWLIGGFVNILWFLYSVQALGYGENAPSWYIGIRGSLRPAVLILSMTTGYMIGQWNFKRACAKGRFS
jgi:hypothetical protein